MRRGGCSGLAGAGWRRCPRDTRAERKDLEGSPGERERRVSEECAWPCVRNESTTGHEEPRGKLGGPPSKAQYSQRPIADKYREGKVKRTPVRGVKENLKPKASERSEGGESFVVTRRALPDGVPIEE